jgi:hypothetical protein
VVIVGLHYSLALHCHWTLNLVSRSVIEVHDKTLPAGLQGDLLLTQRVLRGARLWDEGLLCHLAVVVGHVFCAQHLRK